MSSKSFSNNSNIQTFKQRSLKAEFLKKYFEEKYKKATCTFSYKKDANKHIVKLFDNMYLVRKVNKTNNITETYEVYIQDNKNKHKLFLEFVNFDVNDYNVFTSIQNKNIHFPFFYDYKLCYYGALYNDDKINIKYLPQSVIKALNHYEKLLKEEDEYYKNPKNVEPLTNWMRHKIILMFSQATDGDLQDFLSKSNLSNEAMLNCLAQILLASIFYNIETDNTHKSSISSNYLFEKIKKEGYFHYKLYNKDFYLKNMGFLFTINNLTIHSNNTINKNFTDVINDFFSSFNIPFIDELKKTFSNQNKELLFKKIISILEKYNILLTNLIVNE